MQVNQKNNCSLKKQFNRTTNTFRKKSKISALRANTENDEPNKENNLLTKLFTQKENERHKKKSQIKHLNNSMSLALKQMGNFLLELD